MKAMNKRNLMKVRGKKLKGETAEGEVLLFIFHTVRNPIMELIDTGCYGK